MTTPDILALSYMDMRLLIIILRESYRAPTGYYHLRDWTLWDRYPVLMKLGLLECIEVGGLDIYRLTDIARSQLIAVFDTADQTTTNPQEAP